MCVEIIQYAVCNHERKIVSGKCRLIRHAGCLEPLMRCIYGPPPDRPCPFPRYPGVIRTTDQWCSPECEDLYKHLGPENFRGMTPREYIRHLAEIESAGRPLDWMYRGTPDTTMLPQPKQESHNHGPIEEDETAEAYWNVYSTRRTQPRTASEQTRHPKSNIPGSSETSGRATSSKTPVPPLANVFREIPSLPEPTETRAPRSPPPLANVFRELPGLPEPSVQHQYYVYAAEPSPLANVFRDSPTLPEPTAQASSRSGKGKEPQYPSFTRVKVQERQPTFIKVEREAHHSSSPKNESKESHRDGRHRRKRSPHGERKGKSHQSANAEIEMTKIPRPTFGRKKLAVERENSNASRDEQSFQRGRPRTREPREENAKGKRRSRSSDRRM